MAWNGFMKMNHVYKVNMKRDIFIRDMVSPHIPIIYFVSTLLNIEVLKYMAEAIISRRGGGSGGSTSLRTDTFGGNTNWTVPVGVKGNISVRIFGGGASASSSRCGGSGWMNNGEFNIARGTPVQITIGKGGYISGGVTIAGGTSSFGTYLSANGGSGANGGAGGAGGGIGYQFGGGGSNIRGSGGDGGTWGGGGGGSNCGSYGGNGGIYGGGGGGSMAYRFNNYKGGDGGTYGGGGGSGAIYTTGYNFNNGPVGVGGTYGGNGGGVQVNGTSYPTVRIPAEAGTNTKSNASVPSDCRGYGLAGGGLAGGGGGFGGNGGSGSALFVGDTYQVSAGGGGGYGGSGGNGFLYTGYPLIYYTSSGGGGGYGSDSKGGDGFYEIGGCCGGGGGGYHSASINGGGGGWYNYARGGGFVNTNDLINNPGPACGGSYNANRNYGNGFGGDGICIVQYYM